MTDPSPDVVTLPVREYEELKTSRDGAEEHRKGLLEHARNLEHLLGEASRHGTNLEAMLREKELDLKQTRARLAELESLCYRYEQMLQDAGILPDAKP